MREQLYQYKLKLFILFLNETDVCPHCQGKDSWHDPLCERADSFTFEDFLVEKLFEKQKEKEI